jgi:uncharacterized protein (TIGR02145 family)
MVGPFSLLRRNNSSPDNTPNFKLKTISFMKNMLSMAVILLIGLFSCDKPEDTNDPPAIPVLTTTAISVITQYTAHAGGNVTSDGGNAVTTRGICWSINHNPSTTDSKTVDGTGTGSYTSILTGLVANTTYYVRAYATSRAGTAYGTEVSFVTQPVSTTTVTDIDGNVYPVITIGTQTWMQENLKVTRYSNGESIPTDLSDASWGTTSSGALSIYNNDANSNTVYGKLYNWHAGIDPRKIAPQGWHVPSKEEWETLINFLGGSLIAGGELKETGLAHWSSPNSGATNNSGFNGLPAGTRLPNGPYSFIGNNGYWWTSTEYLPGSTDAEALLLLNSSTESLQVTGSKQNGASIRCIKD